MTNTELSSIATEAKEISHSIALPLGKLPFGISLPRFISDYASVGHMEHYRHIPHSTYSALEKIKFTLGRDAEKTFLRAALAEGVACLISSKTLDTLPHRIFQHHIKQLKRILKISAENSECFDIENDLFLKDFGLVTLRLYAAAAGVLDIRCGIPRSIIANEGWRAAPRNLLKLIRLGGVKPFIQTHVHMSYLENFNEDGRNELYRCCSDLYKIRPELLGTIGSSWFYDPFLKTISPHLSYLLDIPKKGGAELFFIEKGGSAINNATFKSKNRRKLYEEGKYMPKTYMIAWGKKDHIKWSLYSKN